MKNFISIIYQNIISLCWIIWGLALVSGVFFPEQFGFIFKPFLVGWIFVQIAIITGIVSKKYLFSERFFVVLLLTILIPIWNFLTITIFGKDPIMGAGKGLWSVFTLKKSGIIGSAFGILSQTPFIWFIVYSFFNQFSEQSEKIDELMRIIKEIKEGPEKE